MLVFELCFMLCFSSSCYACKILTVRPNQEQVRKMRLAGVKPALCNFIAEFLKSLYGETMCFG